MISAVVNAFTTLVKARPALSNSIFTSLVNWEPNSLASTAHLQIRSVEKTFRIAVAHLLRSGQAASFAPQITDFLQKQNTRMLQAAEEARKRRDEEASKKKTRITDELNFVATAAAAANKRRKLDPSIKAEAETSSKTFAISKPGEEANPLANFDVTSLPVTLVTELIIANLQVVTDSVLATAIEEIRRHLPSTAAIATTTKATNGLVNPVIHEEEDLQLVSVDADSDTEMEPAIPLEAFELPLPGPLAPAAYSALFDSAIGRIFSLAQWTATANFDASVWTALVSRIAPKALAGVTDIAMQDTVRHSLSAYIMQDPSNRINLARSWLSEEWLERDPNVTEESVCFSFNISAKPHLSICLTQDTIYGMAKHLA